MTDLPELNHSILSPSGTISKRARRQTKKLINQQFISFTPVVKNDHIILNRIEHLRLIAGGMPELEATKAAKRLLEKNEKRS